MPIEKPGLSPEDLVGTWIHSHEEDDPSDSTRQVYRPVGWDFKTPSRERLRLELKKGGHCSFRGYGEADGYKTSEVNWALEGDVLVIRSGDSPIKRWQVEDMGPDGLHLRELLDAP